MLGRELGGRGGVALEVAGRAVEALLVLLVLITTRGRWALRVRPLPALGVVVIGGLLLWQALRGLG